MALLGKLGIHLDKIAYGGLRGSRQRARLGQPLVKFLAGDVHALAIDLGAEGNLDGHHTNIISGNYLWRQINRAIGNDFNLAGHPSPSLKNYTRPQADILLLIWGVVWRA